MTCTLCVLACDLCMLKASGMLATTLFESIEHPPARGEEPPLFENGLPIYAEHAKCAAITSSAVQVVASDELHHLRQKPA